MEKKRTTTKNVVNSKSTKKSTIKKTTIKKETTKKQTRKKGFTLIELLAVIIILGILMIIAIPSVTKYISDSRKSAYVDTAKEIVGGARNIVNEGNLGMYDTDITYYLRASCIDTENGLKSPYGEFTEAYVGVTFDGKGYNYYWISTDDTGQGIKEVTPVDKLDIDKIEANLTDIEIKEKVDKTGVDGRSKIQILNNDCKNWDSPLTASIQVDSNGNEIKLEPTSFATDSWATISKAVKEGNTSVYSVGDTKQIDMGDFGTHTVRISNKATPSECSTTGFSQTACGFVIEFVDIVGNRNMNPQGLYNGDSYMYGWNTDGWPASQMYPYINTDIYNSLPSDLKKVIINTTVVSGYGMHNSNNYISTDKLYLLSTHEIWEDVDGDSRSGIDAMDTAYNSTRQLDYYKNLNVTTNNYSAAIKKYDGSNENWWLRSSDRYSGSNFTHVDINGNGESWICLATDGISPAFRIG